jgi:hypothetical protein
VVSTASCKICGVVEEVCTEDRVTAVEHKLKWWQRLALAALSVAGVALVGAVRAVYSQGDERGATRITIQMMQMQLDRNHEDVERLSQRLDDYLRLRLRLDNRSTP